MSGNINYTDRLALVSPPATFQVDSLESLSQFLSGGVYSLPGKNYRFTNSVDFGTAKIVGTDSNTLQFSQATGDEQITITSSLASDTFITADGNESFVINGLNFQMNGASVKFMEISNLAMSHTFTNCDISFAFGNGGKVGSITNVSAILWRFSGIILFEEGVFCSQFTNMTITSSVAINFVNNNPSMTILRCSNISSISTTNFLSFSQQVALDIRPDNTGEMVFIQNGNGPRPLFQPASLSGSITAFTDNSVSAVAVTAVADVSGVAEFTSTAHGLNIGEVVTQANFSESTYNVTARVSAIPTANTYQLEAVAFVSNVSGDFSTTTVEVAATAHGLSVPDSVSITSVINFLGGFNIFNPQTNTFEISIGKAFPGTETGAWNNGSLTEESPLVTSFANGRSPASKSTGFAEMNANAVVTVVAASGDYQPIDATTLLVLLKKRFTLIDAIEGICRYDGLAPIDLSVSASISTLKSGATASYRFAIAKNEIHPVFNTATFTITGVTDVGGIAEFTTSVAHGLHVGNEVTHSTFSTGAYNVVATISSVPTTTTYQTEITFVANDSGLSDVVGAAYAPLEVKTDKITIPLDGVISIVNGDSIQIMVAGDGTSDNLTITDMSLRVTE